MRRLQLFPLLGWETDIDLRDSHEQKFIISIARRATRGVVEVWKLGIRFENRRPLRQPDQWRTGLGKLFIALLLQVSVGGMEGVEGRFQCGAKPRDPAEQKSRGQVDSLDFDKEDRKQ